MAIEVRVAQEGDREEIWALGQQAFQTTFREYNEADDLSSTPLDRRLVAVDNGRVIGALRVWELGQYFGGRKVPMGGMAGGAVEAAHRGRGVASQLLRHSLTAMRERGEVICTLYPMNHALYRRHGWEIAGTFPRHLLDLRALRDLSKPSGDYTFRRSTEDDLATLRQLHESVVCEEPGNVWYGHDFAARRLLNYRGHQDVYVAERDGGIVGSITLGRHDAPEGRGSFALEVRNLVAVDLDAELALLHLAGSYHPVAEVAYVVWPQSYALPLMLGERVMAPHAGGWCWMTRLVDAPGAVAARGYPDDVDVEVHLDVVDDLVPENSGPAVLRVKNGQGELYAGGRGDVRLSVGGFAALYTGWASPVRLRRLGLLEGAGEAELRALDRAFISRTPWAREFF